MCIKEQNIQNWILYTLSIPNSVFNNLPACPYAKQAYLDNKILVVESIQDLNFVELLSKYEVIVYAIDPEQITPEELYELALSISNNTIVALDDHPDYKEKVGEVILNNGEYALLLIQDRMKLEHARKILKSKGYYDNWSEDYLKEVLDL